MRATLNELSSRHLEKSRLRAKSDMQSQRVIKISLWYIVVLVVVVAMLFPLFWMITVALKSNNDVFHLPPQFLPQEFDWENFIKGPLTINFGQLFINSVLITVLNTVGAVTSSMLVGYGLARICFPGRKLWFYAFVGSMMLPGIVTLLPLFHLYLAVNWYDTWLPLIVPSFFGNPLYIFLARQFYLSIPFSWDEAAKVDGAGHLRIFWSIMVPLTRPIWLTMAIMTFTTTWNDYLNPLIYLYSNSKWTLSLGMASFAGSFAGVATTPWNLYMATNILYMLPPLLVFFVAQRYFIQGLSALNTSASK